MQFSHKTSKDAFLYKGALDCSTNPNYPAADTGHTYRITVAGKLGGASGVTVQAGDSATCYHDGTTAGDQATVGTYWNIIERNLDAATETVAGIVELATVAEINTGTDPARPICPDQYQASARNVRHVDICVVAPDAGVAANATTVLGKWESPFAGVIEAVGAYNAVAGVTGTATYDIHLNGQTIMSSAKISIETGEDSSRDATTQPTLTTTALAVGNGLTFLCDAVQSGTAPLGLSFRLAIRET